MSTDYTEDEMSVARERYDVDTEFYRTLEAVPDKRLQRRIEEAYTRGQWLAQHFAIAFLSARLPGCGTVIDNLCADIWRSEDILGFLVEAETLAATVERTTTAAAPTGGGAMAAAATA